MNKSLISKILRRMLFCVLILAFQKSRAGETMFGYLYTTDLQPKGKFELEQWFTDREGQANGFFHHLDMSSEVEYGVTDQFQIALYLNYMYADESGNSVRGKTEGIEVPYDHDSSQRYQTGRFDGASIELLYRFLSPYTDPVGLAAYIEPEVGVWENSLETRLIIQKNFLDDTLILAANIWVELDNEKSSNLIIAAGDDAPDGSFAHATYAEIDLGVTYRFAKGWFGGLEFRNHNEYEGWTLNSSAQGHTAFFFGPSVHYASQRWYATFAALKQVAAIAFTDDQRAEIQGNKLYGDEHTTWDGLRFVLGFPFE